MRLIDADALDEAFTALRFTADGELAHWSDRKDWCLHGSEIEMLIANAPTVEAEPVRQGKWIFTNKPNIYGGTTIKCSACGYEGIIAHIEDHHYCWVCGARMDEGEEEE